MKLIFTNLCLILEGFSMDKHFNVSKSFEPFKNIIENKKRKDATTLDECEAERRRHKKLLKKT